MFRRLKIKWLVWQGKAVDIWSKSAYPADVLSNLCNSSFCFDGIACGSMEGFLQSLKYKDTDRQRQICEMPGKEAKKMSVSDWQGDQIVWWKGQTIDRHSKAFVELVTRAYQAMFSQNEQFRNALKSTKGEKLYHSRGGHDSHKTILTEREFCDILTELRDRYEEYREYRMKVGLNCGDAVDICLKNAYPAYALSNLCNNDFCFDGIACVSMEGFLQSLKYKDIDRQKLICGMPGKEAKKMSVSDWQEDQILWWKGQKIERHSGVFVKLLSRAYQAMFSQNERFRKALLSTTGKKLYHSQGGHDCYKDILTEQEFCDILTELRAKYEKEEMARQAALPLEETGSTNGHAYVDLGLPSGLQWATMNIGARSPGDYGDYYAWGETNTKPSYDENKLDIEWWLVISETDFDVAYVKWGAPWRMPCSEDFYELGEQCKWTWTTLDGNNGYKVTSGRNGNSIFLPAAGWRRKTSLEHAGSAGQYWCDSHSVGPGAVYDESSAECMYFTEENIYPSYDDRYKGLPVRPVRDFRHITDMKFYKLFCKKPVIGMIHLGSLPGMTMLERAQREIEIYLRNGVYPLIENYFGSVDDCDTVLEWISETHPEAIYGINILDDYHKAFELSRRYNAKFIKINTVWGYHGYLDGYLNEDELEETWHRNDCVLLGGVIFKAVRSRSVEEDLRTGMQRCDAIVYTSEGTGLATPMQKLSDFKEMAGDFPVIVGAGVTLETAKETAEKSDGVIVGSWFKDGHDASGAVNEQYVKEFMSVWNK